MLLHCGTISIYVLNVQYLFFFVLNMQYIHPVAAPVLKSAINNCWNAVTVVYIFNVNLNFL